MGMGMGARYIVEATGEASLFSLPDASAKSESEKKSEAFAAAQLFAADATANDAVLAAAELQLGFECDSAACARVKLQELRRANALALPPGANATAGGVEVPCEFQHASRESLLAMTLEERTSFLTRLPTHISGLIDEWPARGAWTDPQRFSQRFGHHTLKAIRAAHGFSRLVRLGGPRCHNFNERGCPGQANATMTLAELVPHSDREQMVIMDLHGMTRGEHDLLTDLSSTPAYRTPHTAHTTHAWRAVRPPTTVHSAHHARLRAPRT